eukprot:6143828-Prymnesium_polylepis.1
MPEPCFGAQSSHHGHHALHRLPACSAQLRPVGPAARRRVARGADDERPDGRVRGQGRLAGKAGGKPGKIGDRRPADCSQQGDTGGGHDAPRAGQLAAHVVVPLAERRSGPGRPQHRGPPARLGH